MNNIETDPSGFSARMRALTRKLASCPDLLHSRDSVEEAAADLSHHLLDIAEAAEAVHKKVYYLIVHDIGSDDIVDTLWDIRSDLDHMLYHIRAAPILSVLLDNPDPE